MILGWRQLVTCPSWHLRFLDSCVRSLGAPGLSRPSTFCSVPVLRLRRQRQPRKSFASVRRSSQKDHVAHLRTTSCSGFMPAISASNTLVAMKLPALTWHTALELDLAHSLGACQADEPRVQVQHPGRCRRVPGRLASQLLCFLPPLISL